MRATMIQERAKNLPNPVYLYDYEYLRSKKKETGQTVIALAAKTGHSPVTILEVLNGTAPKFEPVFNVNRAVDGDWGRCFNQKSLQRLNSQNHRAVRQEKSGGAVS